MSTKIAERIALLAPVPLEHLEDGAEVCAKEGKVAFGSREFLLFAELDQLSRGEPVDVYIYASHANQDASIRATWVAKYIGRVNSVNGAHPQGAKLRPPSTFKYPTDNQGFWPLFWEVSDLRRLPEQEAIHVQDLRGWKQKARFNRFFVPKGPLLIEQP